MNNRFSRTRLRLLAPEVVQTSAMDCGPAALKCLLEGFGIPVSYGRLREACQTDVDGTSIDTMEEVAGQLGLAAEQVMVPADHLLLPEAALLPAIVVVRLPNGITHFVVAWRRHGPLIQIMDPGTGRRWSSARQFLDELYIHEIPVSADNWLEWATSDEFLRTLRRRLANLGFGAALAKQLIDASVVQPGWQPIAALDAATRAVDSMVRSGGLRRGRHAARVLQRLLTRAREENVESGNGIPPPYWSVRLAPSAEGSEQLILRGAVLVHVSGRIDTAPSIAKKDAPAEGEPAQLSPELIAALAEPPSRPARELFRLLRSDGLFAPATFLAALFLAAGAVVLEALLLRGFFDMGRELGLTGQRIGALGALFVFVFALLLLELPIATGMLRFGRHLEARLRASFLQKIPRLGDRYFHSRLTSDMAERSHSVHRIRLLPELSGRLLRSSFQLVLTIAGIAWLDPASAPVALLAAALSIVVPLAAQPVLTERDLRVRSHGGALSRFYMDALLGLVAVRTHGAERAVRREHESLLVEWARGSLHLQRSVVAVEGLEFLAGFGLAAWILLEHLARGGQAGAVLLLVYWALNLPVLGQEIALVARQYPASRNVTLRLLEPLGAPEEAEEPKSVQPSREAPAQKPARGVGVAIEGVTVRAAGHLILEGIDVAIEAGSHVAIVGPSGAGKSSLVGVLLGWHRPVCGQVLIDGEALDGRMLEQLRRETAWVDPAVQLWNRSLLENVRYGAALGAAVPLEMVIDAADLRAVLEKLPDGLQTPLGESGGLVSGGEGQRVRLARAIFRPGVRLVILDEPFRGLDRERRRELLSRARRLWRDASLLCITHDVGETTAFERVLVVDRGRVVEDGVPDTLVAQPGSRYRALLEAEEAVRSGLWASSAWRRLRLHGGRLNDHVTTESRQGPWTTDN